MRNVGLQKDSLLSNGLAELVEKVQSSLPKEVKDPKGFAEEPVDIETFLYDEDYLNLSITLSQPQLDFVDNCSRLFGYPIYTEGVLQCGQGSGKDTCSVFLCLRLVYLLLCLESPQTYFNKGSESFIDIINVAPNASLAKNIFFSTLVNYMNASPWFMVQKEKYPKEFDDTANMVKFPKNIRIISGNSDNEAWQGYTPILIVLDEIDAFKDEQELMTNRSQRSIGAQGVYDTAKTLAQSRFPNVSKVLSLSWPRFKGSFIQKRFAQGKNEVQTYVPCREDGKPYSTWDFNPTLTKEDFEAEFKKDYNLARARFECEPSYASNAFFTDMLPVLKAFDAYEDEVDEIQWAETRPISKYVYDFLERKRRIIFMSTWDLVRLMPRLPLPIVKRILFI